MKPAAQRRVGRLLVASLWLISLALIAAPPTPSQATSTLATDHKLSNITAADGTIKEVALAGDRVVYVADYDVAGRFDLYSTPVAGGPAIRLTADLPPGAVAELQTAATGVAVFKYMRVDNGRTYLYSVPAAGGEPTLLGPQYESSSPGSQLSFGVSPEGDRVVYMCDLGLRNAFELYSVPITGGASVKLNAPLPATFPEQPGQVTGFSFAGSRVVYWIVSVMGLKEGTLYSVALNGGPSVELGQGQVNEDKVSPDGLRIVFRQSMGLRSVLATGEASTLLEGGPVSHYEVTSDSAQVVYAFFSGDPFSSTLKIAPIAGGAAREVVKDVWNGGSQTFKLTPDGAAIIYNDIGRSALKLALVAGGAVETLVSQLVEPQAVTITPDSAYAIYLAGSYNSQALYSVPLSGGVPVRLDDPAVSTAGLLAFEGLASGGLVLYSARNSVDTLAPTALYSVPAGGGPSTRLSGNFGTGQELLSVKVPTAGGLAFFVAGTRLYGPLRWRLLYAVPADGSAPPSLVDRPRALVGDVTDFAISLSAGRAVYIADQTTGGVPELYSVPLAGGPPVRLSAAGQVVRSFRLSLRGGRVAFVAEQEERTALFIVPITGGAAPVPIWPGANLDYAFTPDGTRLLFRDSDTLYSRPGPSGDVIEVLVRGLVSFLVTADSARVIYQQTPQFGAPLLMSRPLAGGEPVVLADLRAAINDATVQLAADGTSVLYGGVKEQDAPPFKRFAVIQRIPAAGGPPTTLLSVDEEPGAPILGLHFAQAPRGGPVLYTLTSGQPGSTPNQVLGSIPLSGAAPSTLYSSTGALGALPFVLSEDGASVLFTMIQTVEGEPVTTLFRVDSGGGAPPVQISGAASVGAFGFAGDGAPLFVEGGKLFYRPRGGTARRIDSLAPGSEALAFRVAWPTVLFTAVRDRMQGGSIMADGTTELYAIDLLARTYLPLARR